MHLIIGGLPSRKLGRGEDGGLSAGNLSYSSEMCSREDTAENDNRTHLEKISIS